MSLSGERAEAVIFDLDDTLVDTRSIRALRESRRWKDAVRNVGTTSLFRGVSEVTSTLREEEIPWAVVTTSVSYYAQAVLAHHELAPDALVAFHDAKRPKPAPDPVERALAHLGVKGASAIGVGDGAGDLQAYRAAGVYAVAAGWSPVVVEGDWDVVVDLPQTVLTVANP